MDNKKIGIALGIVAAAYGIYRYTSMTKYEKESLKAKARDILDKSMSGITNLFTNPKTMSADVTDIGY